MSNGLDLDQDQCFVGPDLGQNCHQQTTSKLRVLSATRFTFTALN